MPQHRGPWEMVVSAIGACLRQRGAALWPRYGRLLELAFYLGLIQIAQSLGLLPLVP